MLQRQAKIRRSVKRPTEMSSTTVKYSYVKRRSHEPVRYLRDVEHLGCSCFMFIGLKYVIIKYFASFGTVSHVFYTHIKNRSFTPKWNVTNYDIL